MDKNQLNEKLIILSDKYQESIDSNNQNFNFIDQIEEVYKEYLKENSQDSDIWINYALFLTEEPAISNPEQGAQVLEQLLDREPENIDALLVLCDIKDSKLGGLDDKLFEKLCSFKTDNNEHMSMIEYAKSRFCFYENLQKREECLIRSVSLYSKHVNNNEELAEIYLKQGKIAEACFLMKKALRNIVYIAPEIWKYVDSAFSLPTKNEYIDYFIKGTYNTQSNLQDLGVVYARSWLNEKSK